MSRGAPGGLFEQSRVTLKKEDVEYEIEGKRAKVEESGQKAPELSPPY